MKTHYIEKLQTIAGLVAPVETRLFVTSTHWGQIAQELMRQYQDDLTAPENYPKRDNFSRLQIGPLTVINAGTEDEEVVNLLNEPEALQANFAYKREHLITGKI